MKRARTSPWALLYKFHRYTGLIVAVVILILAVTGIVLNHTDDLELDKQFIKSAGILDWYGIEAPNPKYSYSISEYWVTQIDSQIYFNTKPVLKIREQLIGATMNDSFIVAAFPNALVMLSIQGEVIEQIDKRPIQNIASGQNERIYIKSGDQVFFSDDELLTWQTSNHKVSNWSRPAPIPEKLKRHLKQESRSHILPYERVLLDVHSGRFFGRYGVYFIDFAGLLMILLTISGCWIWLRHKLIQFRRRKS